MAATTIYVVVATASELKLQSVKSAFTSAFMDSEIILKGYNVPSGVNEQPEGYEETTTGARNRLMGAKELAKAVNSTKPYDYLVAIENGIIHTGDESATWMDIAWVILEDKNGKQWSTSSGGVPFDTKHVEEARRLGFSSTTVGSVISNAHNCDSRDPHNFLTCGKVPRHDYLRQAVLAALGLSFFA